jgi:hypothetical protein
MIRRITLLMILCLVTLHNAMAQRCGTDLIHQKRMLLDPAYAQAFNQFNADWTKWMNMNANTSSLLTKLPGGDSVYEIPVVVHVIHTGGAIGTIYNPTDDTIKAWINYTNLVWDASWPSFPGPSTGGTRIPVRFVLAKRDTNCSSTTGIIRVNGSSVTNYSSNGVFHNTGPGATESTIINLSRWPANRYYNIFIVNKIDGNDGTSGSFVAGYAFLPPAAPTQDGMVILATQFNRYPLGGNITMAHEFGHAFNLLHPFQGGCAASPLPPGCNADGDFCCDTEPLAQGSPSTCPAVNSCNSLPFVLNTQRNIMNYSNCQDRFTANQRDRVLLSLKNQRAGLISSLGATAPPTTVPSVCIPTYVNTSAPLDRGPVRIDIRDGGGNPVLSWTSGGYMGEGNMVYVDWTCKHMALLNAGATYGFTVNTGTTNQVARVYLDLNNDGVLGNSAGERINLTRSGSTHTANYTVPIASGVVNCAPIRMRVIADQALTVDSCNALQYGQAEDYSAMILGTGNAGGTVTISNPPAGGNPSCFGTGLTFTATPGTGVNATHYKWFRKLGVTTNNGPDCDTCTQWNSNVFQDNDTVWVRMSYQTNCGVSDTISNRVVVDRVDSVQPAVYITMTKGTNPSCIDDTITLSVSGMINPGGSPTFQWYVNGNPVTGQTGTSYTSVGLPHGSSVTVRMTSSAGFPCAGANPNVFSSPIVVLHATKPPTVSIALINGTNPGCAGQTLTFRAFPVTGGTNPAYQWFRNGNPVSGATGVTYSGTFNNGDVISARLTSSSPCAVPSTAMSGTISVTHIQLTANISITQATGANPSCSEKPVSFLASITGAGNNPQFQWLVNDTAITGANGNLYTTDSLDDNDRVRCVLTSTDPCVVNPIDSSNVITMTIITSLRPSVNISITKGKNPGCLDSLLEFTAIATDLGTGVNYVWMVNNFPAFIGPVFSTTSMLNGDIVWCRANQTDGGCYIPDTVTSNQFNMVRSTTPNPPFIHLIGNMLTTGVTGTYVWFGPNGKQQLTGTNGNFYADTIGYYYAVTDNNGCWSKPSNILQITLLDIAAINVNNLSIYPNPTNGLVTLDWGRENVTMGIDVFNPVGQRMLHEEMKNLPRKTIDMSKLPSGMYYIVLRNEQGGTATVKVTLTK